MKLIRSETTGHYMFLDAPQNSILYYAFFHSETNARRAENLWERDNDKVLRHYHEPAKYKSLD